MQDFSAAFGLALRLVADRDPALAEIVLLSLEVSLTAVAVAALTVYDMCKAVDRAMTVESIRLEEKSGGKSGPFRRTD